MHSHYEITGNDSNGNLGPGSTVFGQRIFGFWNETKQKITFVRVTNPTDPKAIQVYEGFQGPDNEGLVGSFMSFVDTGALPVGNALIDGEAVAFLPDGHSDFAGLRTKAGGERASFVAFDLLGLEGDDLRQRPLEERRDALSRLVAGVDGVQFTEALAAEGAIVFAHACKLGLEGIVSKRAGSRYRSGPSRNWLKCLNPDFERR